MKRILSCILAVILLASFSAVYAADTGAIQVYDYEISASDLDVLLYARAEDYFSEKNFSVRLGETDIVPANLKQFSTCAYNTSWIFIVEPNTSQSTQQMVKTIMDNMMAGMKKGDNFAVFCDTKVNADEFLTSKDLAMQLVDSSLSDKGDIKLYDTVYSALDVFNTSTQVKERKCLVIISDCMDKESKHTITEVCTAASEQALTVYTVGLVNGSQTRESNFITLCALSAIHPASVAIPIDSVSDINGKLAAELILENEKNNFVLSFPLSELPEIAPAEQTLSVTFNLDKKSLTENLENVDGKAISFAAEALRPLKPANDLPKVEPINSEPEKELPFPQNVTEKIKSIWPIHDLVTNILIAVLAVALIALLTILLKKKRANQKKPNNNSKDTGGTVPVSGGGTMPVTAKVTVTLTNVKTGETTVGRILKSSIKAGRSEEMMLKGDPTISSKQMEFIWQSGCLYVQDMNSRNGTRVNGELVSSAKPLSQSDVIHVGESDFRVNWIVNH